MVPAEVKCGRSTTITVNARDPDGDRLVYEFISSKGKLTGHDSMFDNEVTWTAPDKEGQYQIIVKVSDYSESDGEKISTTEEIITITVKPKSGDSDSSSGFLPGFEVGALELMILIGFIVVLKVVGLRFYKFRKRGE